VTRRVSRGGLKSQRAEAVPIHAHALFGNPFANQPRRDRREQDSAAEMSRGHHQPIDIGWAEYRQMIGRIGPQARPRFFDARVHKARRKLDRGGKNFLDSACCHAFVEPACSTVAPATIRPSFRGTR